MNKSYSLEKLLGWVWIFLGVLGILGFAIMGVAAISDFSTPSQLQGLAVFIFFVCIPLLLLPSSMMIYLGRSMQKQISRSACLFFSGSGIFVGVSAVLWSLWITFVYQNFDPLVLYILLPGILLATLSQLSFFLIRKWSRIKNTQ